MKGKVCLWHNRLVLPRMLILNLVQTFSRDREQWLTTGVPREDPGKEREGRLRHTILLELVFFNYTSDDGQTGKWCQAEDYLCNWVKKKVASQKWVHWTNFYSCCSRNSDYTLGCRVALKWVNETWVRIKVSLERHSLSDAYSFMTVVIIIIPFPGITTSGTWRISASSMQEQQENIVGSV